MHKQRNFIALVLLLLLATTLLVFIFNDDADSATWPTACGQHPNHVAKMAAPCEEIDRAVREAAAEFGIDEGRFRRSINCESHFIDVNTNGQYLGLTQQGNGFRARQVPAFDHDPAVTVDIGQGMPNYTGPTTAFEPFNPFHNARLAARAISISGYREWSCKG